MKTWKILSGVVSVIPIDDIDTDQILPKDYMKLTAKQGFGEYLFSDWRYINRE